MKPMVAKGKKFNIYGASTKGNTILQYFGFDPTLIITATEWDPNKCRKVTVGTHIPIISKEEARKVKPYYFLVLPSHFIEEFKQREKEFLVSVGRCILPAQHFTLI